MDRREYITRSRRAFVRIKKANEPKARAASSLSGIRLKKVDEKKLHSRRVQEHGEGAHHFGIPGKKGKPPFPFVDITTACSNNFRFKVSGAHERICPDQQDPDVRAPRTPRP